jgi:hypothetical protein
VARIVGLAHGDEALEIRRHSRPAAEVQQLLDGEVMDVGRHLQELLLREHAAEPEEQSADHAEQTGAGQAHVFPRTDRGSGAVQDESEHAALHRPADGAHSQLLDLGRGPGPLASEHGGGEIGVQVVLDEADQPRRILLEGHGLQLELRDAPVTELAQMTLEGLAQGLPARIHPHGRQIA